MSKRLYPLIIVLLAVMTGSFSVQAASGPEEKIRSVLQQKFPKVTIKRISPSPLPGIYEVEMPPHIIYMSADGRYVLNGDLIDLPADRNITQEKLASARADVVNQLGEDSMIVFAPKQVKHTISVFTDIDCGYCRKLHKEIADYNALGIKVRYLAYPRSGPGSESFKKAESVWCSKDRKQAMTDAKSGKAIAEKTCDNPVQEHFMTGARLGVQGTPAIFLEDGQLLPGYFPAERLFKILEKK